MANRANSGGPGADPGGDRPYSEAVGLLQDLRQELVAMNPEVQFSFRDQVEPVYRQLVRILLTDVEALPEPERQERLERSRQTMEALQLAQVQNFLRSACETYETRSIEQIDPSAAVVYPIVLGDGPFEAAGPGKGAVDRLEVILSLPGQPLQHYGSAFPRAEQQQMLRQLRQALNPAFPAETSLPTSQQLYDRLIRPGEILLKQQKVETLVFVLDGFLRDLPMAILHDGDRYLIETYRLALTPGLQLFESRPLSGQPLKLLAGGLSEARQGFSPLPGVSRELGSITAQLQNNKPQIQVLLNQDFTQPELVRQVDAQDFSVVHLATHGQFSSKAEDTFLLTWDDRLKARAFNEWLKPGAVGRSGKARSPVELLILSACQTARGDTQATLGLAGMAVRSGARTTLATLWSVQDQSTADLMSVFYEQLFNLGKTRAEALRRAQISLLQSNYSHPYYWAPFVLVGNWQ
ncbi:MAG: CHAT domain-containing protein [Synechococcales cyanobacterium CRU_2_2]|nr:CHAT domain-containing protein [Synechococcales cyanobacterium CRU_2_2]